MKLSFDALMSCLIKKSFWLISNIKKKGKTNKNLELF